MIITARNALFWLHLIVASLSSGLEMSLCVSRWLPLLLLQILLLCKCILCDCSTLPNWSHLMCFSFRLCLCTIFPDIFPFYRDFVNNECLYIACVALNSSISFSCDGRHKKWVGASHQAFIVRSLFGPIKRKLHFSNSYCNMCSFHQPCIYLCQQLA